MREEIYQVAAVVWCLLSFDVQIVPLTLEWDQKVWLQGCKIINRSAGWRIRYLRFLRPKLEHLTDGSGDSLGHGYWKDLNKSPTDRAPSNPGAAPRMRIEHFSQGKNSLLCTQPISCRSVFFFTVWFRENFLSQSPVWNFVLLLLLLF